MVVRTGADGRQAAAEVRHPAPRALPRLLAPPPLLLLLLLRPRLRSLLPLLLLLLLEGRGPSRLCLLCCPPALCRLLPLQHLLQQPLLRLQPPQLLVYRPMQQGQGMVLCRQRALHVLQRGGEGGGGERQRWGRARVAGWLPDFQPARVMPP